MPPKMKTPKREASSRPAFDPSDLFDAAQKKVVKSDGVRKRAARAYINNNQPVPPKLLYRALPEFDRLRAAARRGEGSSSGAGSSFRALVRTQPREDAPEEEYDSAAFGRSLSELDFVPDNAVESVVATICERSATEAEELVAQRRDDAEVNDVLLEKGIATSLTEPLHVGSSDEE